MASGSTAAFTLGGTAASPASTQVVVGGSATLDGATLDLSEPAGFILVFEERFFVIDNMGSGAVEGSFGNTPGDIYTDAADDTCVVNYLTDVNGGLIGNDVSVTVLSVVPEPSTWVLLGLGTGLLGLTLRRRATRV